jgi:hypothetical protein
MNNFMEEKYNDLLRKGREVVSERYTPQERRGIEVGGRGLEIGVLLVGGCVGSGGEVEGLDPYDREEQRREAQEDVLECWAKENGCWFENTNVVLSERFPFLAEGGEADVYFDGNRVIKAIGLDYFVSPQMALDRIVLHNFLFEYSTPMRVMGYGRNGEGYFKVVVEQPYIRGERMSEEEIEEFTQRIGFDLRRRGNWTYTNDDIYISDLHNENVLRTPAGNVAVIDADVRLNLAELGYGGMRGVFVRPC